MVHFPITRNGAIIIAKVGAGRGGGDPSGVVVKVFSRRSRTPVFLTKIILNVGSKEPLFWSKWGFPSHLIISIMITDLEMTL